MYEANYGFFIGHKHNDKSVCISKNRTSDVGTILKEKEYEQLENCVQSSNSSNTASETNVPQSKVEITATEPLPSSKAKTSMNHMKTDSTKKSFNGGVFFGGIVCGIALLLVFTSGWNKFQLMRNGTPVKYGLLSPKQACPNTK